MAPQDLTADKLPILRFRIDRRQSQARVITARSLNITWTCIFDPFLCVILKLKPLDPVGLALRRDVCGPAPAAVIYMGNGSNNVSTRPSLSANARIGTPTLFNNVRCKFASGVGRS